MLVVIAWFAPAAARPPFPQTLELRASCERATVEGDEVLDLTTCALSGELARAGAATLFVAAAGSDVASDRGDRGYGIAALTLGLDVNLGRERGDFGVELLYRMSLLAGLGRGGTRVEPFPFTYAGLRFGVGWRWLELGGSPFPRPEDPRVVHLGYGFDAFHWVIGLGLGLYSSMRHEGPNVSFSWTAPSFGGYCEILGRLGDFRVGLRAILGAWQSLQLILGWHFELLGN